LQLSIAKPPVGVATKLKGMMPKRPIRDLNRAGNRFSDKIMLKDKI
jgi:hypothetical protein